MKQEAHWLKTMGGSQNTYKRYGKSIANIEYFVYPCSNRRYA